MARLTNYFPLLFCWLLVLPVFASSLSPIGKWKTIDDETGRARSILSVLETPDHKLIGKLEEIYPDPGTQEDGLCHGCKGKDHNKPLLGLTIMWGLSKGPDAEWKNGYIMDPKSGKVYRVNLRVIEDGNKMKVHGYIGMPLFGRTQVWERV